MDKPPAGYGDIPEYHYDSVEVAPGKDLLFTVPANHISPDGMWYMEIPYWYKSIPTGIPQNENANWGGTVAIAVQYGFWDIPSEHCDEFRTAYTSARQ